MSDRSKNLMMSQLSGGIQDSLRQRGAPSTSTTHLESRAFDLRPSDVFDHVRGTLATDSPSRSERHLLLSIIEAAKCLGISRTHLYEILGRGELVTVRLGRRRMVRMHDLEAFVASLGGAPET